MKHKAIRGKMKITKPLRRDPIVSRHVPKMKWFRTSHCQKMLKSYSTIYIKPDKGSLGEGIIRVKKRNSSASEIAYQSNKKRVSTKRVVRQIKKHLDPKRKYLIQQGIDLVTYKRRPFDVRIVLKKSSKKKWRVTLICTRVAPSRNSIVTNKAQGAEEKNVIKTLQRADQPLKVRKVYWKLVKIAYRIAKILGSHFPLKVVALDMAIDKKGKVWFIEANTDPSRFRTQF